MRDRLRTGSGAWLLAVACGPVLGTVWWLLAPTPQFVVGPGGSVTTVGNAPDWFGADGWFFVLGAVLGVVLGLVAALRWQAHPVAALLGLSIGLLVAALLAWWLGGLLGAPPLAVQTAAASAGDRLAEPLGLRATGVLVTPAFLAVAAFGAVVAARSPVVAVPVVAVPDRAPVSPTEPAPPSWPA